MRIPLDQGAKILKETGQQRYQNALKYGNNFKLNNEKKIIQIIIINQIFIHLEIIIVHIQIIIIFQTNKK